MTLIMVYYMGAFEISILDSLADSSVTGDQLRPVTAGQMTGVAPKKWAGHACPVMPRRDEGANRSGTMHCAESLLGPWDSQRTDLHTCKMTAAAVSSLAIRRSRN